MPELLCLGQIDAAASPGAAAAEVYYRTTNGYGSNYGTTDPLLVYETQDFPPCGPNGRCIGRRLHITIEYGGSVTVRITPITDFQDTQPSMTFNLASPFGGRKREVLDVPFVKALTFVRAKVEVLARSGLFYLHGVRLAHRPLTDTYEQIAGPDV